MKKGYWVVAYQSISDESAVKTYAALARPALESFGARLLTSSTSQIQVHEAGLPLRTIVVEFDNYEIAWVLTKARLTKRRFRHWDPAQSATSALSRACRLPMLTAKRASDMRVEKSTPPEPPKSYRRWERKLLTNRSHFPAVVVGWVVLRMERAALDGSYDCIARANSP